MRKLIIIFALLFNFINIPASSAQYGAFDTAKTVKPFKLFDNLYYVGNDAVSAYLLVTDKGIILIDALYGKYAGDIPKACRELTIMGNILKSTYCRSEVRDAPIVHRSHSTLARDSRNQKSTRLYLLCLCLILSSTALLTYTH